MHAMPLSSQLLQTARLPRFLASALANSELVLSFCIFSCFSRKSHLTLRCRQAPHAENCCRPVLAILLRDGPAFDGTPYAAPYCIGGEIRGKAETGYRGVGAC